MEIPDGIINDARNNFQSEQSMATKWNNRWWAELRTLLTTRCETKKLAADLHEVVDQDMKWFSYAMKYDDIADSNSFALRLAYVGHACGSLYTVTKRPSDAAKTLFFRHYAFNLITPDKANLHQLLRSSYAFSLMITSEIKDCPARLQKAAEEGEIAASSTVDEDVVGGEIFGNLGNILRQKYVRFGDTSDLHRSIWATKRSLTILEQKTNEDIRGKCQDLCFSLSELFGITGNPLTLDEAIDMGWRSIRGSMNPETYCDRISNLVAALQERYLSTLHKEDATASLELLYNALDKLPQENVFRARCYSDLARCYRTIYGITNELQDLKNGIEQGEKGLKLRFPTWRGRSRLLHDMALLQDEMYKRTEEMSEAQKAIHYAELALDVIPEDDKAYSLTLNQLANIYDVMYMKTKNRDHLDFSLNLSVLSAEYAPDSFITNLNTANKFLRFFLNDPKNNPVSYLESAAEYAEKALGHTIADRDAKSSALRTAGLIQEQIFKRTLKTSDLDRALGYLQDSYESCKYPSLNSVKTVRMLARLLSSVNRWEDAWKLLHEAVEWIPILCPTYLAPDDQQNIASELSGLSREACSAAVGCGKVHDALIALEQGRGIIVSATHRANFDLQRLQRDRPDLYTKYADVRAQLSNSLGSGETLAEPGRNRTQSIKRMKALTTQLTGIIQEIQSFPEFEDFLSAISINDIKKLADVGSIVVLNNSSLRNDAIIIQNGKIWSIRLPEIENFPRFTEALGYMPTTFMNKIVPQRGQVDTSQGNSLLSGLLQALWWHIGKPVTEALGLCPPLDNPNTKVMVRHVRWMPTGSYSRVPIHAAGIWTKGTDKVMARCHSSYVSTFRSLKYAQNLGINVTRQQSMRGLIVSMERPDGGKRSSLYLPTARKERESITSQFSTKVQWDTILRPSAADMLDRIPDCSWLHVACHGMSDFRDPSKSFLKLERKNPDASNSETTEDILTVKQISDVTNHRGAVAFLSACSTAESRVGSLFDENLSIAYSFQLAGFPHVIASLWPSYDQISLSFAQFFYQSLARYKSDAPLSSDIIAFAVSRSVMDVTQEFDLVAEPLMWANFIHIGP